MINLFVSIDLQNWTPVSWCRFSKCYYYKLKNGRIWKDGWKQKNQKNNRMRNATGQRGSRKRTDEKRKQEEERKRSQCYQNKSHTATKLTYNFQQSHMTIHASVVGILILGFVYKWWKMSLITGLLWLGKYHPTIVRIRNVFYHETFTN